MKKNLVFELFILAFLATSLIGCLPSIQPTAVPLAIDDQKVSLEILQDEISVPVSSHNNKLEVVLKVEPFTLKINGDKNIVSIMALRSEELALPLLQSSRPWVAPDATGNVFSANDLYLSYQSLAFYTTNSDTLQNLPFYSFSVEQAADIANTLKHQLGAEPLALLSARTYLNDPDQSYLIKTINGKTIHSGESVFLLVFIEKQSNDPFFRVLQWLMFNVDFRGTS